MTTDVECETSVIEETVDNTGRLQAEIEQLLEFKRENVRGDNLTPCPACTTFVQISANRCPNCESNIAPHNALVRESLRRLDEIAAELDGEHDRRPRDDQEPTKRSLWARIKRLFSNPQGSESPEVAESATEDTRFLSDMLEGDHLKVLECHGPWYKVKRRDGETGWVYSTFVRDR